MIGMDGERESGKSMLVVWFDDDDDILPLAKIMDLTYLEYVHIFFYLVVNKLIVDKM